MNRQRTHSPVPGGFSSLTRSIVVVLILFMTAPFSALATAVDEVTFDEISLTLKVDRAGTFEIPAVIAGNTAYLSVSDLFSFLRIKHITSSDRTMVSGFFLNQDDVYQIDYGSGRIHYRGEVYSVSDDLVQTASGLYLSTGVLKNVFGLDCTFHFRSLSVFLKAHDSLPLFRELQHEEKRKYLNRVKGEMIADTVLTRFRPLLHLGTADWALNSTQDGDGSVTSWAKLALGGHLVGGETTIRMDYYIHQPFSHRNLYYRWRHVNNHSALLKQLTLGKIAVAPISSIFSPVIGFQLSNSPTTYRRFFATHTLTDHTEPGWTVELYVNNTLVDYTTADASGFFVFDIPLSYGKTEVTLRYYGEWGEERSEVRHIQIPYSFLPKHELEYQISGGMIEDEPGRLFFRSSVNYGVTNHMTIGVGFEYLDASPQSIYIPFLNTSFSLTDNILFSGEYAHGVKATGLVSFRLPSNLMLDISYTRYVEGQQAIYHNYLEERKIRFSFPVRFKGGTAYSRFSLNQLILPSSNQLTQLDHVFTASYRRVSANIRTYTNLRKSQSPAVYSEFSAGYRLSGRTTFTQTIYYRYDLKRVNGWKFRAEKKMFRNGHLTFSYEEYPDLHIRNFQIGLRHVFPSVHTSANVVVGNHQTRFTQSAGGGFIFDQKSSYAKAASVQKVGRSGIVVLPFLDVNNNGKHDQDEPRVSGVKVRTTPGGRQEADGQDTLVRIFDLEPYTSVYLELNGDGLESITWQLKKKSFRVLVEPNLMKRVEVPVSVVSEVSGSLRTDSSLALRPGSMKMNIIRPNGTLVHSFYSEDDGYYSYMGLPPGVYTLLPDTARLADQQLVSLPASRKIHILPTRDGSFIEGLDFMLQRVQESSPATVLPGSVTQPIQTKEEATDSVLGNRIGLQQPLCGFISPLCLKEKPMSTK